MVTVGCVMSGFSPAIQRYKHDRNQSSPKKKKKNAVRNLRGHRRADGPAPRNHGGCALPHPLLTAAAVPFPIPTALRAWVSVTGSRPRALDPCRADTVVADSLGCVRVMGGAPSPGDGSVQGGRGRSRFARLCPRHGRRTFPWR
jgi:hypothetical protein